jgi:acetyltransferase-like isoleucine patch superfamily enzyme
VTRRNTRVDVALRAGPRATVRRRLGAVRRWVEHVTIGPDAGQAFLTMGRHSYAPPRVHAYPGNDARARVGAFCSIAADAEFLLGGYHHPEWVSTFPFRIVLRLPGAFEDGQPTTRGDIVVGNDVWIGRGAKILSGVTVADGAVVGAYAVVTRDVRPYAIVVGNPARELRRRFDDARVNALLASRWWEWPLERIVASVPLLCSPEVDAFLKRW